ncbi:flavin reductase family protein [Aquabacter sp. L1I39]|uniref:flavin reductase family protein n=1 Tax=Aquabacter TaxID=45402 RepID=UPI001ADA728A|nr:MULTISPECIES: flavin reductase family protein [unclassified Aquabacter]MDE1569428.1 flavin reductase family protein [Aquabacter sp. P-9]QTL02913.1 flavin reductase family protein [Aquabacter sp. L1I39]
MSDLETLNPILPRHFRDVLGAFATGVVVVTTNGSGGRPVGLTINSFNSVSLDPPLILWSLALKAPSLPAFQASNVFNINILAEHQEALGRRFATPAENKFADVDHAPGLNGAPVLADTAAHMECRVYARYPGGDHEIYVGEVTALQDRGHAPLVYHRGGFRRLHGG